MSEKNSQVQESNKISNEPCKEAIRCPYEGIFTLENTINMMFDPNYKVRFIAEYIQLKVRYEKLKHLLNKWDAFGMRFETFNEKTIDDRKLEFIEWLGFLPSCSREILQTQQHQMGLLLNTLEVRAVIEGIDLTKVTIVL